MQNSLYNLKTMTHLAGEIKAVHSSFDCAKFKKILFNKQWDSLVAKDRMRKASTTISQLLDMNYEDQINVLIQVSENSTYKFANCVLPDFVQAFGIDHFEISMFALKEFTKKCTSEYAIRQIVNKYPEESALLMYSWADDEHFRVRRLASEGCRPLLPGTISIRAFVNNPLPIIPILNKLKFDDEHFVRKSVSNNFNDISKNNSELVLKLFAEWRELKDPKVDYIIKRGLRTLLKQQNETAEELVQPNDVLNEIRIKEVKLDKYQVKLGEKIKLSFIIEKLSSKHQMEIEGEEQEEDENIEKQDYYISYSLEHLDLEEAYTEISFDLNKNCSLHKSEQKFQIVISTDKIPKNKVREGDCYAVINVNGKKQKRVFFRIKLNK